MGETPSATAQLRNQLSTQLPLVWFSLAFIGGIVLGSLVFLSAITWLIVTFAFVALAFIVSQLLQRFNLQPFDVAPQKSAETSQGGPATFNLSLLLIFPLAILLGAARYQLAQPDIDANHIAFYNDRDYEVFVTGMVAEMPDYRDTYTNLRIKVSGVDTGDGDYPVSGFVLVRVPENQEYHYGQFLRLRGNLKTPPENEDFSYQDYLARSGVYSYMTNAEATVLPDEGGNFFLKGVYTLKEKSLAVIYKIFPDPEASLLAGILLGVDTGLPKDIQDAFKNTGTAHIIAISGFNIAIIAGIFITLFSQIFGPRLGAILAIAGIAFYTLLVGAEAAVVRAALMGTLSIFAKQVGRRNLGLNTLAFVALLMAFANPLTLWDVGFQLSFFATLGLILYAEPLSIFAQTIISRLWSPDIAQKIIQPLSDFVLLTLAAQITTIPIMAYHFQRISLISFVANPFILPAQPAVMILGGLAMFIGLLIQPLGQLAAWITWPFAAYTIRVVEFFNVRQGTIYLGDFSLWFMLLFYGALLSLTFSWPRLKEWFSAQSARIQAVALTATFAFLFICTVVTWRAAFSAGDGQLHVTFLDVGSANAVLIQTPEGRNVLINGGPSTSELSDELGRRLPLFNRKLDWLVIASTREDELSSLPRVVERYAPKNVLWSGNVQASFSAQLLDEYFADNGIPVTHAETGQKLDLGEGAFIEVQAEGPRGSVLVIHYKDFSAALPVGVSDGTWEELEFGNVIGKVDVLLLADSGFALANPPDIIENMNPGLAVISVSAGDPDGMPAEATLDALEGYSLLRTDRSGWIDVSTDGTSMRVEVERPQPVSSEQLATMSSPTEDGTLSSTPAASELPFTVSGTLDFRKQVELPEDARVIVIWGVSSTYPDYDYLFGEGRIDFENNTFEIVFDEAPPDEALNRLDSDALGVGTVMITTDQTLEPGKISMEAFSKVDILGASGQYGVIYREGNFANVPWSNEFHQGYGVGKGIDLPDGTFDIFEPADRTTIEIIIDDIKNIKFVNWT
jgi:competence protein ComEC